MAGEIRNALARLKASQEKMIEIIVADIDAATSQHPTIKAEAGAAVRLAHSANSGVRAEIQEIVDAFAEATNGDPDGPLLKTSAGSSDASAGSGTTGTEGAATDAAKTPAETEADRIKEIADRAEARSQANADTRASGFSDLHPSQRRQAF